MAELHGLEELSMFRLGCPALWLIALGALLPCGCATYADRLAEVRQGFSAGQLKETDEVLQKAMKHRRERDVLKLDQSIVLLASGKPKDAERET